MKFRFRLRTLLIAVLLLTLPLAWYVSNRSALAHEKRILREVCGERKGRRGIRIFHSQCDGNDFGKGAAIGIADKKPTWPLNQLGATYDANLFERIHQIDIRPYQLDDRSLPLLAKLPDLSTLMFCEGTFTQDAIDSFQLLRPEVTIDVHRLTTNR